MFDFFKKHLAGKLSTKIASPTPLETQQKKQLETDRVIANLHAVKQAEVAKAASFAGQEEAALAFILQSDYADARLEAVMHIHTPEALMKVGQAMRNTDRRVSKLAQKKLAELQNQQQVNSAVQACLVQGEQLLKHIPLMVNEVALWDKQRLALGEHGLPLLKMKVELDRRLQEQLDLQRQVMQVAGKLQLLVDPLVESNLSLEQAQSQLAECRLQWQEIQSSVLKISLPKNHIHQVTDAFVKAESHVEQLVGAELSLPVVEVDSDIQPGSEMGEADKTTAEKTENQPPEMPIHEPIKLSSIDVEAVIAALEHALAEGSLQQALDLDKSLRKAGEISSRFSQRLSALRNELNRLLDWARWGGNISREELIKFAENLATAKLSAPELAKQVGGLRARWKELDRTSGAQFQQPAQLTWERFDQACNRAYQVAEAYFKQQAQVRLTNLATAQAQLAAMDEVILELQNQLPDWKAHQIYINKVKMEWRKTGAIDRKLRVQLDAEFDQKVNVLLEPLTAARAAAKEVRQQLIESVAKIPTMERDAAKKVQQAQQRWQQEALKLPLAPKVEQVLWRQFRAACEDIFARRTAHADEQKQRRNQAILTKEACCAELEHYLENKVDQSSAQIKMVLAKAKKDWGDWGNKAKQDTNESNDLNARFSAALRALEQRYSISLREEKKVMLVNLRGKIKLCQQVENASAMVEAEMVERRVAWQSEWQSLGTNLLPAELNKLLEQRFNKALADSDSRDVGDTLAQLEAQLEEQLLRIELIRNLASPPELAQQRLQLQVQELQAALKNRDVSNNYLTNFYALCALSVRLNAQQEQRFQTVLDDYMAYA